MALSATITLTDVGIGIDDFSILQSSDNFVTPIVGEEVVLTATLLSGHTITNIDDTTTVLRIQSNTLGCSNFIYRSIGPGI